MINMIRLHKIRSSARMSCTLKTSAQAKKYTHFGVTINHLNTLTYTIDPAIESVSAYTPLSATPVPAGVSATRSTLSSTSCGVM